MIVVLAGLVAGMAALQGIAWLTFRSNCSRRTLWASRREVSTPVQIQREKCPSSGWHTVVHPGDRTRW